ncbi:MAG: TetR/AcrR family transcriptional regulator [Alphaproteobacteria bacterium]|nr:TetR/AcrR family transcriptional regulator [Alphaproteobacteria bacterium]
MAQAKSLKPRKQPRQERSRATVKAILEAAAQVFCRYGYAEGTTDRVAERAGVSVGSLYQYFPNKESLLLALANFHMEEGFDLLERLLCESTQQKPPLPIMLRRFVEALMELHLQNPDLHRVLFNEAPLPPSFSKEKETREHELSLKIVNLLASYEEVQVMNLPLASYILVQSVEGLVHSYIIYPVAKIEADELIGEVVEMMHRYLTSASSLQSGKL